MPQQERGRAVIVTGATSGIGRATVFALARAGFRVMASGRRRDALDALREETEAARLAVAVHPADVRHEADVKRLVDEAEKKLGRIDVVVPCAGVYYRQDGAAITTEVLRDSLEVNFWGAVHLILAVLPGMVRRHSGHIIAVTSVDGRKGLPMDAPYVAAKFALTGFLDSLRQDLRPRGVHVTTILPGRVDTAMIRTLEVPLLSKKVPAARVAGAILRATHRTGREVLVPLLGPKTLLLAQACSSRLGDALTELFDLKGRPMESTTRERHRA